MQELFICFVNLDVYSGEVFTLSAVVVGGDFGPTIGVVRANFLPGTSAIRLPSMEGHMYYQLTNTSERCTQLNYSLHSSYVQNGVIMYLATLYTDAHND